MSKGKFGLSPASIAVIAFVFCALMQPQSVLLVAGFALLAEKDEWLNRQVVQALLLIIGYFLAELVLGLIFGGLARFFIWVGLRGIAGAIGRADAWVGDILTFALIAFSVLAVLRVLRGEDADLPFIAGMTRGDLAMALQRSPLPKPPPVPKSPVNVPSKETAAPQTPVPPAARPNLQPPVRQTATVGRSCSSCGAAVQEASKFCTTCGTKSI